MNIKGESVKKIDWNNKHLRVARHVARRLFQVFVTWPAQALGGLAIVITLLGGSPIHDTITGIYAWADTAVRNAPVGSVMDFDCGRRSADKAIDCKRIGGGRAMPVADAIQATETTVFGVYQGLVLVCVTVIVFTMGWREFAGLPDEDKPARPAAR